MKEVCIIVAMLKEAEPIVKHFTSITSQKICGKRVFTGKLNGKEVKVIISGVGKVNAALSTQIAYSHLSADIIVNIGVAGGLNDTVEIGKIYEIQEAVQYDVDLREINNTKIGTLDEMSTNYLRFDITQVNGKKLATADRFNDNKGDNIILTQVLDADIRDMEGAAILQACYNNRLECYCYKVISDKFGSGNTIEQYQKNLAICIKKIGKSIATIIQRICGDEQ